LGYEDVVGEEEEEDDEPKGLWELFVSAMRQKKRKDTGKFRREVD